MFIWADDNESEYAREKRITIKMALAWLAFFLTAAAIYIYGGR